MKRTKELAMKRLLSAFLAAAFLAAPLPAFAQTAEPAPATEAPAPGEAPASSTGVNTVSGEQEGEANVAAAEEHATPHYPLKKPEHMDWSFAGPFGKWAVSYTHLTLPTTPYV